MHAGAAGSQASTSWCGTHTQHNVSNATDSQHNEARYSNATDSQEQGQQPFACKGSQPTTTGQSPRSQWNHTRRGSQFPDQHQPAQHRRTAQGQLHARAELPHKPVRPTTRHPAQPHKVGLLAPRHWCVEAYSSQVPRCEGTTDQALTIC